MTARVLSEAHKRRMLEGRKRAAAERKRTLPDRLAAVERRMDELGLEYLRLRGAGAPVPWSLRDELRELGRQRLELRWPGSERER